MGALIDIDEQLITSMVFLLATFAMADLLRTLIKNQFTDPEDQTRIYLMEIASQFERVVGGFESVFVLQNYGLFGFFVFLLATNLYFNMRWEPTKSTLQSHALKLVDGREDAVEAITMTSIEFVTSMLVYPLYIKQVWLYFDNQPQRGAKVHGGCASDVQAGLLMSSLAEMGAAFTLQVTALILAANIKNIILRTLIQVTVLFFLVIACNDVSGSYFNPSQATAVQVGCDNVVVYEHILCYWVAPFIGFVMGAVIFRKLTES